LSVCLEGFGRENLGLKPLAVQETDKVVAGNYRHLRVYRAIAQQLDHMETIHASASASITELKRNPSAVIEAADGESVAVLVHNKPSAYLMPAETYKRLLDRLDDLELAELVRARSGEKRVKVKLDDL
jgi:antitoxin StbD